jgi:disulfide bond formation protein DsbB
VPSKTLVAEPKVNLADAGQKAGLAAWTVALIGAAALVGAWIFEFGFDIKPCPLCLEQRYAYYGAIPLALLLALAAGRGAAPHWLRAGLIVVALAMLGNAGLGVYHAGVEWGLWQGPTGCSGPMLDLGKAGSLLDQLDKVKVIRCDEVQWRFLGLSLAGYNVLISLAMAATAGFGALRAGR